MPRKLWVEYYRPTSINGYLFQNKDHKIRFLKYIEDKSIPHLLLTGHRGTGKTTLALILKTELGIEDVDFKILNASDDNSVDVIRNSVKAFASSMPLGDFKIVFLDEADYLTRSAQAALRGMMEQYSETVRFILTCNQPHKIMHEIKSRCNEFEFNAFDRKAMSVHVYRILKNEKVMVDKPELIHEFVTEAYPDMRKLINNLESSVVNGALQHPMDSDSSTKVMVGITDQLSKGNWLDVREHIIKTVENGDWDEIYRFLYDNLDQVDGFDDIMNWKQGIIIIANHLRFHAQVADPEINFTACMIQLSGIIQEK